MQVQLQIQIRQHNVRANVFGNLFNRDCCSEMTISIFIFLMRENEIRY